MTGMRATKLVKTWDAQAAVMHAEQQLSGSLALDISEGDRLRWNGDVTFLNGIFLSMQATVAQAATQLLGSLAQAINEGLHP